jgi:NAD-dependent dihydropyrimidine dehydrogenase PreA subunit
MAISIDYDLCEASGACAAVCPEDVLEHVNGQTSILRPEACIACWLCVEQCVAGAIQLD